MNAPEFYLMPFCRTEPSYASPSFERDRQVVSGQLLVCAFATRLLIGCSRWYNAGALTVVGEEREIAKLTTIIFF